MVSGPPTEAPALDSPAATSDGTAPRQNSAVPASPALGRAGFRTSSLARSLAGVLLALALLAALVLQPGWPAQAVAAIFWVGGLWRWLLVPACAAALSAQVAANTREPGRAWMTVLRTPRRLARWLPLALAALFALGAGGVSTGLLSIALVLQALLLLAIQVALFPGTPVAALLVAALAGGLYLDARRLSVWSWLWQRWTARSRSYERAIVRALPAATAAALSALVAASLFPAAMQGWGRADAPDAQRYNFYSSFFNYAISDDRIVQREGYDLGKLGLVLRPGMSGSITFKLDRIPEALVLLKANFYNHWKDDSQTPSPAATFANALELSTDQGNSYRTILSNASIGDALGNSTIDLTPLLGTTRSYLLRFRATNTSAMEVTVLPSLVISTVADPSALPHPSFPVVPYFAAAGLVAYWALRHLGRGVGDAGWLAVALVAVGALAAAATPRLFPTADGPGPAPLVAGVAAAQTSLLVARAVLALALVGAAATWLRGRVPNGAGAEGALAGATRVPWLALACIVVAVLATDVRWQQLIQVRYEYLLPDAQGYEEIARSWPDKMAHYEGQQRSSALLDRLYDAGYDGKASAPAVFYAGGNNGREPLWPATLRLAYNVLGISAFHTRLTSIALAVAAAALTCWFGWRLLHPLVGLTAGALFAFNHPQAVNSVGGLREELVGVLFLLLLAALFLGARRGAPVSWWRLAGAGVAGAGLVLVRADMLVLAGLVITCAAVALRWRWWQWVVAVAMLGVLAGPMYVGYAFTHGDPFYPGTYGATVNRNLEFPERMGTPGFPTADEYAANWAAGPKISPMKYFFGYHAPRQFVEYSIKGFTRIFPGILFEGQRSVFGQPWEVWVFVAGMVLLVLRRKWAVPFAIVVGLGTFYAFMAGVPSPWVFAPRYAHHVLPYTEMAAAYAIWFVPLWLLRLWRGSAEPRATRNSSWAAAWNV